MECPSCHASLTKRKTVGGFVYMCSSCGGLSVTLPVLRNSGAKQEFVAEIWRKSRAEGATRLRPCPLCARSMAQVHTVVGQRDLTLDVCPRCPAVWFDTSEFQAMPRRPPPPPKKAIPPEVREKLALLELEQARRIERLEQESAFGEGPTETWQWLPGLLGLPVEIDAPQVSQRTWVTWAVILLCTLTTLWLMMSEPPPLRGVPVPGGTPGFHHAYRDWGFVPAEWYRHGGLTLMTSFFIHVGWLHLLGNMYFLFVFGDNVEDRMGRCPFVLLLVLAHGAGMLAQAGFGPDPTLPCVGASAGISGVIAYYAIAFPRARLAFMFRYFLYIRWFRLSAVWMLALYAALQLFGAHLQIRGFGSVSYLGHLGGLVVGVTTALVHKGRQDLHMARTLRQ